MSKMTTLSASRSCVPAGKQYLLDPRLGNHKRLRQCGVNGYFSARALAKFLDTLPYVLSPGVPEFCVCMPESVLPQGPRACMCGVEEARR